MSAPAAVSTQQAPLVAPGHGRGLLDVVRDRYLLKLLVRKEMRVRYRGSVMGLLWSYVKPGVQFAVFYFAMGYFLKLNDSVPNFAVYLFSGIVVINFYSEAFGNATRSVVGNAPLIKKIFLPRELFAVSSAWVAAIHFLPQLIILLLASLVSGWRPSVQQLGGAVLAFVIVGVLAVGLGLLFGAVNVLYRDFENIVDLLLMIVTWTSPVLYDWQRVADAVGGRDSWIMTLYQLNPITSAVELFHWAFWYPTSAVRTAEVVPPLPPHLLWSGLSGLLIALVLLGVGQAVFRRIEGRFAQEL
ncbi:ABC transporter permease [Kineococcus rubinsiae]|uniref:ABC transporter permease n=1 Tax=Kineococcus rubinsiae TaxID=2609562 RepID=UPI0027E54D33|nr:ABC transporter permease [Kineococcus rubinsiae]